MAKKTKPLFHDAPVMSYPYVKNRLLIIDWASLSYHQFFSIGSDKNREKYGLLDSDGELALWRNKMMGRVLHYITLFNPNHVIFALEGKAAWRRDFVKEYYAEHTTVYWNSKAFYVESDNYTYEVMKTTDGSDGYSISRVPVKNYDIFKNLKHRKLSEFDSAHKDMFWNLYTASGVPVIPSYKGTRKNKPWKFVVDRHLWMDYKDTFAKELAPLFRARAIKCPVAEGDDVIYASVMKYAADSDDVIVVTGDSDMSQIDVKGVRIFNHRTDTFVDEPNPGKYLDMKVLAGDTSDNINGMAFIDPKTGKMKFTNGNQIGMGSDGSGGTAAKLMEACPDIYRTACDNGWADQYMRNRKLIDLSMVPSDVKKVINEAVSVPEPPLMQYPDFEAWDITDMYRTTIQRMQGIGFYCMQHEQAIKDNPNIFNRQLMEQADNRERIAQQKSRGGWDGLDSSFVGTDLGDIDVIF